MFSKKEINFIFNNLHSSYNKKQISESYGNLFYGITSLHNPKKVVEIGTCKGYSSVYMAKAIKDCNNGGLIHCYDLWEDETNKSNFHELQKGKHLTSNEKEFNETLNKLKLNDYVKIYTKEAFSVLEGFKKDSVDIIHVDIGNCGSVLEKIIPSVIKCLKNNGMFLFEGGSEYRDNLEWANKFKKKHIKEVLENNALIGLNFEKITFDIYPSLTMLKLKKEGRHDK